MKQNNTTEIADLYINEWITSIINGFNDDEAKDLARSEIKRIYPEINALSDQTTGLIGRRLQMLKPKLIGKVEAKYPRKICKHCGESLLTANFYKSTKSFDGLQSWCKQCMNEYNLAKRPKSIKEKIATIPTSPLPYQDKREVTGTISFTYGTNNVQIRFENGEFRYSRLDGREFTDNDLADISFLKDYANEIIAKTNA
jgi:hypothetical protein